jgi:hypothetical protein
MLGLVDGIKIYITYSTQKGIDFSLNTPLHPAYEDVALRGMVIT